MKVQLLILLITGFFIYNAYTDGRCWRMLFSYKKYYKMATYAAVGLGALWMITRNPAGTQNLMYHADTFISMLPLNRSAGRLFSSVFDTTRDGFMGQLNERGRSPLPNAESERHLGGFVPLTHPKRNKRSVSETKKKYVAAKQDWLCGHCGDRLDHTYEIDHRIRLEYGGSNEVDNLVALCRNCHGRKTANENM